MKGPSATRCAVLGCGYIADYYMATQVYHPALEIVACHDANESRQHRFAADYGLRTYRSFDELLADPTIDLVLNLTNPRAHFATTRACLESGKHVYSEKPLAMTSVDAAELAALAAEHQRGLSAAPCSLLSPSAQTLWKSVRDGRAGVVRLVYGEFEDGMVHRHAYRRWRNRAGTPWPAKDEFEVGCTFEHASYVLSWLAAIFGPVREVTAFASCRVPDKGIPVGEMAPDYTVGNLVYESGVVARVTCGLVAETDKSIRIFGDEGTLSVDFVRNDVEPVTFRPTEPRRRLAAALRLAGQAFRKVERATRLPRRMLPPTWHRRLPYAVRPSFRASGRNKPVDFLRGPADLADAIRTGRPPRLSAELGVHLIEIIETLQHPERFDRPRQLSTGFEPIEPMEWH